MTKGESPLSCKCSIYHLHKCHQDLCTFGLPDLDNPALQCGLHRLGVWTNKWQMHFNPDKCEVMRITHRKDKSRPVYSLGRQFRSVENITALGVLTTCSDLSWGNHVLATVNKANMVLGIIKRSIRKNQPRCVFAALQVTSQTHT